MTIKCARQHPAILHNIFHVSQRFDRFVKNQDLREKCATRTESNVNIVALRDIYFLYYIFSFQKCLIDAESPSHIIIFHELYFYGSAQRWLCE